MILTFVSKPHHTLNYVKFDIDRKTKILKIWSRKTGYEWKVADYNELFNKAGTNEREEGKDDTINDEDMAISIIKEMDLQGYSIKTVVM